MGQKIVIVGSGIIGASIAYYLTQRETEVTLIDQSGPAAGVSGNSFAWLNGFEKQPYPYHLLSRMALHTWHQFAKALGNDIDFQTGGCLFWADNEASAKNLLQTAKRVQGWGYTIDILDRKEFVALEPNITIEKFATGVYCRDEACVDAKLATLRCIEKAKQQGAKFLTNTKVNTLNREDNRIHSIDTNQGEIDCDVLILAAGADTAQLAYKANIQIPLTKSPGILITAPTIAPIFDNIAALQWFTSGEVENYHIRQYGDGHVIMGRGTQAYIDENASQDNADKLLQQWQRFIPELSGQTVKSSPMLLRPMTEDGQPIIGFDQGIKNLYISVMHSGVTLSALIGKLAAMEILNGIDIELLKSFRLSRFQQKI